MMTVAGLRIMAGANIGHRHLESKPSATTLIVVAHGLLGRAKTSPLVKLVRDRYPDADILTFDYEFSALSNLDPYLLTSSIEQEINAAYTAHAYDHIVLVGHSAGAILLRKALVWASGYAEDRPAGMAGIPEQWPQKVERFVSISGINRGWTLDPKPRFMSYPKWLAYYAAEKVARLSGTGGLLLAFQRGAPYIADLRVQWIHFARSDSSTRSPKVPFTLHLLGDIDDVVSKEDSRDIGIAKETCFLTLQNTNHQASVAAVSSDPSATLDARQRYEILKLALSGAHEAIHCDPAENVEEPSITRVVFIMHGIRDYGEWTNTLAGHVTHASSGDGGKQIAAVPAGYGYFPMMPFLLYWDRQRNVRWFMDQYTEQLASFPNAEVFDYVGHSNGTYILASALQRYSTLKVRNVYFAGSVAPQRYDWMTLIRARRVTKVYNVVATDDWVVAWFPRLFEQLAEWGNITGSNGLLDLGAAGFRGFRDGADPLGRVINLEFVPGNHGTGVNMRDSQKLYALQRYVIDGDTAYLDKLGTASDVNAVISFWSNLSWLVWLGLAAVLCLGGYMTARLGRWWLAGYVLLVLALLNSV
jgi:pimeloyl-ACP methyl ester carboxylesterase